ncbi:MAG: hypothetical protein NVS3B26_10190 [Mycobacteriales bacterium]
MEIDVGAYHDEINGLIELPAQIGDAVDGVNIAADSRYKG